MSPRPDVSEERRNQILDSATRVFARLGFHDARMDDIVAESGLSKGSLYWYFESKDDLIIAILDRLFEREMSDLRDLQLNPGPASERIRQFTELTLADFEKWLGLLPVAYEFLGLIFRRAIVKQAFRRYLRSFLDLLIPIIQEGIDNGEFRPVDAEQAAITVSAIFEGTILLWVYDPERVDVGRHIRQGIELMLMGLKTQTTG